jgi:hypothetical protein
VRGAEREHRALGGELRPAVDRARRRLVELVVRRRLFAREDVVGRDQDDARARARRGLADVARPDHVHADRGVGVLLAAVHGRHGGDVEDRVRARARDRVQDGLAAAEVEVGATDGEHVGADLAQVADEAVTEPAARAGHDDRLVRETLRRTNRHRHALASWRPRPP